MRPQFKDNWLGQRMIRYGWLGRGGRRRMDERRAKQRQPDEKGKKIFHGMDPFESFPNSNLRDTILGSHCAGKFLLD
jgi:hypothetical protein